MSHAFRPGPSNPAVVGMLPTDRRNATALALRIVAAGEGRVRQVVVIGSRARGNPRPASDLDLVVIIETPLGDAPWSMEVMAAERHRIIRAVGVPPVPTDLWVLTIDQAEEGRAVAGGIEEIANREGVVVFSAAPTRPPIIRRSADVVRRQNTRAWIGDSLEQLAGMRWVDADVARRAVEKAVMSLCVFHQVPADTKADSLAGVLSSLRCKDPEMAHWLEKVLPPHEVDPRTARVVVRGILHRLRNDPQMRTYLAPLLTRLSTAATQ